jgi:hypothetical protein
VKAFSLVYYESFFQVDHLFSRLFKWVSCLRLLPMSSQCVILETKVGVVGDRDHGRRYINLSQHTGDGQWPPSM